MKPTFQYLLLSRDCIRDEDTKEISAIRIFDTIFIPKDQDSVVYSFHAVGRINLNTKGLVSSEIRLKITGAAGDERTVTLSGTGINAEIGLNINAYFPLVLFKREGKYSIETSVNINGGEFVSLQPPLFFWVRKVTI